MYPNFDNKQDRSSKRQDLLARIARDQRLEAMKREAYANALWATDSEDSKTKDATETGDTLTRIVAAMKAAASSSNKPNPSGYKSTGDIYDAMGDAPNGVFSEIVNNSADNNTPATEAPTLEEPILNEVMIEEKREPDEPSEPRDSIDSGEAQRGISLLFGKYPFLSNINFKPVISKDGEIQEHNYIVRHTDGKIASKNGTEVPSDNELLQYVDWEKTFLSIKDRTESLSKLYNGIQSAMIILIFKTWRLKARAAIDAKTFDDRLGADDDQLMASVFNLSPEEKADLIRNLPPPDEDELMLALSANREAAIKDRVAPEDYDQFMESVSGQTNEEVADIIMKQSNVDRDELMSSLSVPLNRKLFMNDLSQDSKRSFMDLESNYRRQQYGDSLKNLSPAQEDELMRNASKDDGEARKRYMAILSDEDKTKFINIESESKSRVLEDKKPDPSFFKDKVKHFFDNIDGMESLKIKPYIKVKASTKKNETETKLVPSEKVYFGPQMQYFNIKTDKLYGTKDPAKLTNSIDWEATLQLVIHELGMGARALTQKAKHESSPMKREALRENAKNILIRIKEVDLRQGREQESLSAFPMSSFDTPAPQSKQDPNISAKKDFTYEPSTGKGRGVSRDSARGSPTSDIVRLVGRGLKGAGRPYNLADIEGSGRASYLKYKRIGSKFIRKADLNANRLKLVFPSRNSVGPIRPMSNELTDMVKDLLYNDNISQQAYRALSVEDQRVFYEIVQKTHVNHTLREPMIDPRITLKAEFDKLRGETALGNDNQDMRRELYRLATDMFEQKMISNKEFKSIMSALL